MELKKIVSFATLFELKEDRVQARKLVICEGTGLESECVIYIPKHITTYLAALTTLGTAFAGGFLVFAVCLGT